MFLAAEIYLPLLCVCSHICVLFLLSVRRSQLPPYSLSTNSTWPVNISVLAIKCAGVFSAAITLALPYTSSIANLNDPPMQSGLRCICFFYAGKLLDLSVCRAPPTRIHSSADNSEPDVPAPMDTALDHVAYVYLLATEMRYPSFDIAVSQKNRPSTSDASRSDGWTRIPHAIILGLTLLFPNPETMCLLILVIIQLSFEALHTLLHFRRSSCNHAIFYKPFGASSFSAFWATHWHACAGSFLQTLAYRPGERYGGKWLGVLATFNLTGIWHAWAAIPHVEPSYRTVLAIKVWSLFMIMGIGILAERWVWGEKQGGFVQRVVVWSIATLAAGACIRGSECHASIAFLRPGKCR